ncbi:MAG: ABC transporter substrate-binding protein [Candidatus Methylomirabilales bacterium]
MHTIRHTTPLAAMISLLIVTPGIGSAAEAQEQASIRLKWHHQTQFAGVYVARQKGFYRQAGLQVKIHGIQEAGELKVSPIQRVVAGEEDFGITSQSQFLVERSKGAPVVAIAAIYQRSPVGFFTMKRSGISRPQQFVGKTVTFAPTHEIHLKAMLRNLGTDFGTLKVVPYSYDLTPWYSGKVDVWAGYIMNQPVDARLAGHEVNIILPDDYGVHMYDDILFTTEQTIAERPKLVERFLTATLRGWRYTIENPEEATEITLAMYPHLKREKQLAMLLASIPLIHTGEHQIGWMVREIWEETQTLFLDYKILSQPVDLQRAITVQFLQRIYAER